MSEISKIYKLKDKYSDLDCGKAIRDLSEVIKCKSVSDANQSKMDFNEFKKIHEYIFKNYPNIMKNSTYKIINEGSIYFEIKGSNLGLDALLLMGHIDVVPSIQDSMWEYEPFSGEVSEDFIYGRGAMDMKHIDVAILNAVEYVLEKGKKLERSIYICFGHDEETLGMKGQWEIKNDLKKRGVKIGMVIDEGGSFEDGSIYKSSKNLAIINVMEKGYLDLVIEGFSKGGHSSMPSDHTALGNVATAISRIENRPFKPSLNKALKVFYKELDGSITDKYLASLVKDIDNNLDKIALYLSEDSTLYPLVKTTIAPTMISSDSKGCNVLPKYVKAIINFRLSDSDDKEEVFEYLKDLCKDLDVKLSLGSSINASNISSTDSKEYKLLTDTIKEYFDDVVPVPFITIGGTDACFYNEMSDNVFRFCPIFNDLELESGVHGVNEHCAKDAYIYGIKFYIGLIEKYCM